MKIFIRNALLLLTTLVCLGCQRKPSGIPVQDYPLDTAAIEAALQNAGLDWNVRQEEEARPNVTTHTLLNSENKIMAFVSSAGDSNSRGLQLVFMSSRYNNSKLRAALPQTDWDKALHLSALLYGGFETEDQLINESRQFLQEHAASPCNASEAIVTSNWKQEIDGIICIIQMESSPGADQVDLTAIRIYNDTDFAPKIPVL